MDVSRLLPMLVLMATCGAGTTSQRIGAESPAVRRLAKVLGFPTDGSVGNSGRSPTPRYMLDLYNSVADARGRSRAPIPYGGSVVRSYGETEPTSDGVLRFAVPPWSEEEHLAAELHVHVPHVAHGSGDSVRRVRVHQIMGDGGRREVDSGLLSPDGGHHVFHVLPAVTAWQSGEANLGLQLIDETAGGDPQQLSVSRRGHHHNKQPLLVVFGRDNSTGTRHHTVNDDTVQVVDTTPYSPLGRLRRSLPGVPSGCERRDLLIDFISIGWSMFLVAPDSYNAYRCVGRCEFPLTQQEQPTNHATVQSLAQQLGVDEQVARPSCVPSSLASLTVLYYQEDQAVVLKKYVDMVAEECGCH